MAFPTLISNTALGADASVGANVLIAVDLSDCTLAIVHVVFWKSSGPGAMTISTGVGWVAGPTTVTDGSLWASRIFYKVNPTNAETLIIANSTSGTLIGWAARLVRLTGADTIAAAGVVTNDPPSADAGSVKDLFVITAGGARVVAPYTAGPSGYTAFDFTAIGANVGSGFAYTTVNSQVVDPGAFTGGGANRRDAWTVLAFQGANNYSQSIGASTSPVASTGLNASKAISAATSAAASLRRGAGVAISCTTSAVASIRRAAGIAISRTTSAAASLTRSGTKAISRTTSPVSSVRLGAAKVVSSSTSPAASLRRGAGVAMSVRALFSYINGQNIFYSAGLSTVAGYVRPVPASTTPVASERASGTKVISRTTSPVASVVRGGAKALLAATVPAPVLRLAVGVALLVRGLFSYNDGSNTYHSAGLTIVAGYRRSVASQTAPGATVSRSAGLRLSRVTAPAASLVGAVAKHILAAVLAPATLAVNAGVTFLSATVGVSRLSVGAATEIAASTTPEASLSKSLLVRLLALGTAVAGLVTRFFEFPSECNTIVVPSQDRIIVIDTCDPKTWELPARYTPESMLYGVDLAHRLDEAEIIVTATVTLMNGDLDITDVQTDGRYITFRLAGGSPVYQRLAIAGITNATPANIVQVEATIVCAP